MANIDNFIPFLIYWETSVKDLGLSNEQLFAKAKTRGIITDPYDRGGATLVGVTVGTYCDYCKRKRLPIPSSDSSLSDISYRQWLDILKTMFWDRWQADKITGQRVAEMLVDWVWMSGSYGITIPQKLLGVNADGVVGPKTLAAVNSRDPSSLSELLKRERIAYIDRICSSRPANRSFRSGWLRRITSL
ncbi:MAG: peptidoglycan domain protein [Muribaculaceae bacterium]|nr:peptidoglycan domain protein [Muribaculaceae bacterium]